MCTQNYKFIEYFYTLKQHIYMLESLKSIMGYFLLYIKRYTMRCMRQRENKFPDIALSFHAFMGRVKSYERPGGNKLVR
jgi:hypothetical protein